MEPLPLSLLNDFLFCNRRAGLKIVEGLRELNGRASMCDGLYVNPILVREWVKPDFV